MFAISRRLEAVHSSDEDAVFGSIDDINKNNTQEDDDTDLGSDKETEFASTDRKKPEANLELIHHTVERLERELKQIKDLLRPGISKEKEHGGMESLTEMWGSAELQSSIQSEVPRMGLLLSEYMKHLDSVEQQRAMREERKKKAAEDEERLETNMERGSVRLKEQDKKEPDENYRPVMCFLMMVALLVAAIAFLSAPYKPLDVTVADLIAKDLRVEYTDSEKAILRDVNVDYESYNTLKNVLRANAFFLENEDRDFMASYYAKYQEEERAINTLKKKSPELFEKVKKQFAFFHNKLNALEKEARDFAEGLLDDTRKNHHTDKETNQKRTDKALNLYNRLSVYDKMDFSSQFPITAAAFERAEKQAKKIITIEEDHI
ncbi:hypothetical protein PENTCL1PPCAC_9519 [Pristionchus entomophagus]|uniref:Uncharacterized protein n=1 Tax=Pristionchus entomophagus TaxID=358040 RepID=A0AAV5T182_9BILA|nr:hypothetical protein PENTCL1PPCAC_9519 [Pristionchus entomophagus]